MPKAVRVSLADRYEPAEHRRPRHSGYGVFERLDWASLDRLTSRLSCKCRRLLRERIDSFACWGCRLLDDDKLREPRKHELPSFLQLSVTQLSKRIEHLDDVFARPAFAHVGEDGLDEGTLGEFLYGLGL